MLRPFLSLLVAGAASAVGLSVLLIAAQRHASGTGDASGDLGSDAAMLAGVVITGVAAASLTVHWVGALVVGSIHFLLGGIAVLIPVPGFLSGSYSPTWEIARMLSDVNQPLGEGATVFFFSGVALVLGAFLVGAALAARSRWESAPVPRPTVTSAAVVGAVVLLAAVVLLVTVGNDFVTDLLVRLKYDLPPAIGVAFAAVLAGIGGLTLRWSSAGCVLTGAVVFAAGAIAIFATSVLPFAVASTRIAAYGLLATLGLSLLAAGVAAGLRRPGVPATTTAL